MTQEESVVSAAQLRERQRCTILDIRVEYSKFDLSIPKFTDFDETTLCLRVS